MTSEIAIRPAEELDVPKLVRLLRRSWLVTWAPELPWAAVQAFAAADPAQLHAETGWNSFMVAAQGNMLLGMVHPDRDLIGALHVGRPTGMAAWDRSCSVRLSGKSHVHTRLRVWKCVASTPGARAFYARRGWVEVRRYPGTECGSPVENVEMQRTF
jgi:hypothetical protein